MSSSDRLLLILHVGFAIFTLGPLTAATMATPRYIRRRDVAVLRYLTRATRIYGLATLGIFLFGIFLAHGDLARVWLSASMTLFIVALGLLVLIERDQRRSIQKLMLAAAGQTAPARRDTAAAASQGKNATATAEPAADTTDKPDEPAGGEEDDEDRPARPDAADEVARVERGRIASLSGVVALIWLVTLFLMIWYSRA